MQPTILAIDEGTTGVTVMLVDVGNPKSPKVLARHNQEFPQHFPKSGWVEHDLEDIWSAVRVSTQAVFASVNQHGITQRNIVAIGITNQRETLCVFDRKTGKPLTNAIVWQCRRSHEICTELRTQGVSEDVNRRTGLVLDPYFTGTKISWLMANNAGVAAEIKKGSAVFGTIDTFLLHRLTGFEVFATESSNASRTLLYNLKGHWDSEMLRIMRVPSESCLPEVKPSVGVFGKTKAVGFLPDGIPVAGIVGDQQAALAGQACFAVGEAKCTYGTGAFLLLNTGDQPVYSKAGLLTTIAWNLDGKLTYAMEGASFIAGAAVQFLRDQLGFLKNASEAEELAKNAVASPGLYFVPALSGLGAPYWDPQAKGAFLGMHRGTTRAELIRAALEGIIFQVTDLAEAMARDLGSPLKILRADGGAANNNFLMQFQSDMLNTPVDRPLDTETTAIGAAMFAGLGIGIYKNLAEIVSARSSDLIFTATNSIQTKGLIDRQKRGWVKAVEAVRHFGSGV